MIQGIGCIIIFANEPAKLANWYSTTLDVKTTYDEHEDIFVGALVTVPSGSRIEFGIRPSPVRLSRESHGIMISYQVNDLDACLDRLRSKNVEIEVDMSGSSGRFAQLSDPEGNLIQLWQPITRTGARA